MLDVSGNELPRDVQLEHPGWLITQGGECNPTALCGLVGPELVSAFRSTLLLLAMLPPVVVKCWCFLAALYSQHSKPYLDGHVLALASTAS
jgi:hypothetical protein